MDEFRQYVLQWLERRGWSQARLAEATEISQSLVSKHLADDPARRVRPSPENLARYAPVLGVEYEDLMRMLGYLPGTATVHEGDQLEADIRARTAELLNAVRGAPRIFWPTIIRATFDGAINTAQEMARLLNSPDADGTEDIALDGSADRGSEQTRIGGQKRRHRPIKPRHQALAGVA